MVHSLDSSMIFIHPTLAFLGYIFIVISCYLFIKNFKTEKKLDQINRYLYLSWFFSLLGLLSGMIWAGSAWKSFWSWDPKETVTLIIFACLCLSILQFNKNLKYSLILVITSLCFVIINVLITISGLGLHSY